MITQIFDQNVFFMTFRGISCFFLTLQTPSFDVGCSGLIPVNKDMHAV